MKVRTITARGALLGGIWLLLTMFGAAAPSAWAHNELTASNPVDGSVMAAAPGRLELTFAQAIDPKFASVAVTAGTTDLTVDLAVAEKQVTVVLGDLPDQFDRTGVWKLGYRMISTDGHPVSGLIQFSVDPAAPNAVMPTSAASAPTEHAATGQSARPSATPQATVDAAAPTDGGPGPWGWGAVIVLVVVAVSVSTALYLRNRGRAGTTRKAPVGRR